MYVGLCSLPNAGHQGVGGSVRKRAEACLLNVQEKSKHLLSHLIRNDVGRTNIRQDFHYTDADLVQMIIDALQGSDSSSLGDLAHGHCMLIFQEVNLISEARQVVALDQGNDHSHHYYMATISLVIDHVP